MSDAIKYLTLLGQNKTKEFTFVAIPKVNNGKVVAAYQTFKEAEPKLKSLNEQGYDIFVTVNHTGQENRKKEHVKYARAIWVEDDDDHDIPRTDFPLKPSLIVQSSPKHYHYYWLTETTDFEKWDSVMAVMVTEYGCDKNAKDRSRILRLPGFVYKKKPELDFTSKLVARNGNIYPWKDILSAFAPAPVQKTDSEPVKTSSLTGSLDIQTAMGMMSVDPPNQHFYEPLRSIALSYANKGMDHNTIKWAMKGILLTMPENLRTEGWHKYGTEEQLDIFINSALKKVAGELGHEVSLKSLPKKEPIRQIKYPPGLMGTLCEEIYEMAPTPTREAAIATAFGLVAGIVGRKYLVSGMGLNLYIALLMDAAIGKSVVQSTIGKALNDLTFKPSGAPFLGPFKVTGPKALLHSLQGNLSKVCVFEEAVWSEKSQAGDKAGLSGLLLELFTRNGPEEIVGNYHFSSKDHTVEPITGPACTIVSIAQPELYWDLMRGKGADVSGDLARLWPLEYDGEQPFFNHDRRSEFSDPIKERLTYLIGECLPFQQHNKENKYIDLEWKNVTGDASRELTIEVRKAKSDQNNVLGVSLSRVFEKSLRISGVVSVFNNECSGLSQESWDWALGEVLSGTEMSANRFSKNAVSDIDIMFKQRIVPVIVKCMECGYDVNRKNAPKQLRGKGMFTYNNIAQCIGTSSPVHKYDDSPDKSIVKKGLEKMFDYGVRVGWINKVSTDELAMLGAHHKTKDVYKITEAFAVMIASLE